MGRPSWRDTHWNPVLEYSCQCTAKAVLWEEQEKTKLNRNSVWPEQRMERETGLPGAAGGQGRTTKNLWVLGSTEGFR